MVNLRVGVLAAAFASLALAGCTDREQTIGIPVAVTPTAVATLPGATVAPSNTGVVPVPAALFEASARGDTDEVRRLLSAGVDPDAPGPGGRTPVTAATYAGHAAVVQVLIAAGADIDRQDDSRANPLLAAGETGDVAVLRVILAAGPDLRRTNRFGGTALIPAADRGHVETVKLLLATAIPVDHVNNLGWTALLEAVILGDGGSAHNEIVKLLLDAGADPNIADRDGVTPLQHAQRRGYSEMARNIAAAGGR